MAARTTLAVVFILGIIPTITFAAQMGSPCGSSAGGGPGGIILDPNPPVIWSYPTCEVPVFATTLCRDDSNGWFSAIRDALDDIQWREKCCPPGETAIEQYDFNDDGDLVGWELICDDD